MFRLFSIQVGGVSSLCIRVWSDIQASFNFTSDFDFVFNTDQGLSNVNLIVTLVFDMVSSFNFR